MQIDDALLNKLEKLSSLKIGDEKRDEIKRQLSEILSFVDVLSELNLSNETAAVSALGGKTPLRDDAAKQSDVIENILKNAPARKGRFFVVPKIIE